MSTVETTSNTLRAKAIPFYQSLFVKVTGLIAMTALIIAMVVAYLNASAAREMAVNSVSSGAIQLSSFLADGLAGAVRFKDTEQLTRTATEVIETSDEKINAVAIFNGEGATMHAMGPVTDQFVKLGAQSMANADLAMSPDSLTVAAPIQDKKGNIVGAIVVGGDVSAAIGAFNNRIAQSLWISAAVLIAALVASSFIIFHLFTRPLRVAETAMAAIAVKDFDIELPVSKRRDEIGSILRRVLHFRDELEEADKNARMTLFQSSAFRGSSVPMVMVSQNNKVVGENKAWEKLLAQCNDAFEILWPDLSGTSVEGKSIEPLRPHLGPLSEALNAADKMPFKTDISLADQKFSVAASAILDENGEYSGSILEMQHVTERRLNSGLLDAIRQDNGIVEIDLDGKVRDVNGKVVDVYGLSENDLIGLAYVELPGSDTDDMQSIWNKVLAGESVQKKVQRVSADGQVLWLDIFVNPVIDYKGDVYRVIEISNDITAQEVETERLLKAQKAEEANQKQVVGDLRQALSSLANGNLSQSLSEPFSEEYEQLRADFNRATKQLCAAILEISEVADNISDGAREISQGSDELSQRTENQAATLEQTAAALEEITASVRASADGAKDANEAVLGARENAQEGGQIVLDAVAAMNEIESSANQISQIIGVIDDIAFQTNLLALNAGVEAARAGEAGRGFAVVASEVRALAQRSSEAAKEIKGLISASSQHVDKGVGLVGKTGDALNRIVESVENISGLVGTITASSQEQSIGLAEINDGVTQLDSVTQQNAAMVQESTAASHAMRIEAEKLDELIGAFDVGSRGKVPTGTNGKGQGAKNGSELSVATDAKPEPDLVANSWQDF